MSSLEDKLVGILSDPDAVSKLKSLGEALGLDGEGKKPQEKNQDMGFNQKHSSPLSAALPFLNGDSGSDGTVAALMRLAPLLSDMGKDDEATCLLNSLGPFLSGSKRKRLEQAQKMLKVMRLLPIIRESGLL